MAYLKFYADEHARHPDLSIPATQEEVSMAIKKLTRHYFGNYKDGVYQGQANHDARPIRVVFESRTTGHAYRNGNLIDFPAKHTTWLLIVHEFTHIYLGRKGQPTGHTKRMARAVDRICDYVRKMGWAQASLDAKFSAWCATQPMGVAVELEVLPAKGGGWAFDVPSPAGLFEAAEPVRSAACPVQVDPDALADVEHDLNVAAKRVALDKKISAREAQVKRLERRIKSLTTRAKKAARSLRALRRSRDRLI